MLNTCRTDFTIETNRVVQALKALNGKNSMASGSIITDKKKSLPSTHKQPHVLREHFVVTSICTYFRTERLMELWINMCFNLEMFDGS